MIILTPLQTWVAVPLTISAGVCILMALYTAFQRWMERRRHRRRPITGKYEYHFLCEKHAKERRERTIDS